MHQLHTLCRQVLAPLTPVTLAHRAQIGKSGASWVTQALLLVMGSISAAMPVIAAIFGCVVTAFFFAVNRLRKEMVVSSDLDRPSSHSASTSYQPGQHLCVIIMRIRQQP